MSVTPESRSAIWQRLDALARGIEDAETRAQYLATWRARYDATFPAPDPWHDDEPMLPDGRVADLSVRERGRLQLIGAAWLARAAAFVPSAGSGQAAVDNDAVKRFAWACGRRVAAGMVDIEAVEAALVALLTVEGHDAPDALSDEVERALAAA